MSFGRVTQMLEMNFEVLQHFIGSLTALIERVRNMYNDARQLSSTVTRQSLEFGQSSLSTVREARSHFRRHPIKSLSLIALCITLLARTLRRKGLRLPGLRRQLPGGAATLAALS